MSKLYIVTQKNTQVVKSIFFFIIIIFSFWLSYHTFSYDQNQAEIIISNKYWSDFGAHLPLIRSFSMSENWPPQYPVFPGKKIKYHYLFFLGVGIAEKLGLSLDHSLNIPSSLGIILMLASVYKISLSISRSFIAGFVAVLLVMFNSSLSWYELYMQNTSQISLSTVLNQKEFASFSPWKQGSQISAFWNWNIWTNQRHLPLGMGLWLYAVYCMIKTKSLKTSFIILGPLSLINQSSFLCLLLCVLFYFIQHIKNALSQMHWAIFSIPWIFIYFQTIQLDFIPFIKLGFMTPGGITMQNVSRYWLLNLGLTIPLFILSILILKKRHIWLYVFAVVIFLIPNIFQLSPDIVNNHKLINAFILVASIFISTLFRKKAIYFFVLPFLTLGGIVDSFPIINDSKGQLQDIKSNSVSYFFYQTPKDSVVLNSTWFYHPASLSGRKIFNGYPYFTWSMGYNQTQRENIAGSIYSSPTKPQLCELLISNNIDYFELSSNHEEFIRPNKYLFDYELIPVFVKDDMSIKVYSTINTCKEN